MLVVAKGRKLRKLRLERGWTQTDVAVHPGMNRSFLSDLECGGRVPSLRTLEVIAQGFELTLFPERFRRAVWKRPCLTWRFSHAQITFTVFQLPSPDIPDSYPGERSDGVPPPRCEDGELGNAGDGGCLPAAPILRCPIVGAELNGEARRTCCSILSPLRARSRSASARPFVWTQVLSLRGAQSHGGSPAVAIQHLLVRKAAESPLAETTVYTLAVPAGRSGRQSLFEAATAANEK